MSSKLRQLANRLSGKKEARKEKRMKNEMAKMLAKIAEVRVDDKRVEVGQAVQAPESTSAARSSSEAT